METPAAKYDFVRTIVAGHLADGTHKGRVVTRFPPEPNGYLHIGHAKSICLNFGIAQDFDGVCHMRFDDTNPAKEEVEYVESIQNDIRWLGFDWGDHLFFASNYFEQLYQFAVQLIKDGKAYVCDLNDEQTRELRGTLSSPGRPSPFRDRSVEENLDLFARMRAGEFEDGERVLRGRIDMANANMLMRDPLFYRIRHVHHHRTGDTWCIYPLYDFAHCLSDAIECITHSICTLEFENNRELYDWILDALKPHLPEIGERPHQYEFARLNLAYTMMSKRNLLQLVKEGVVNGWDDPRMPTVAGMRRRGYTPEAIRAFCAMIGVAKANSMVDIQKLEYCVRDDLNKRVPRRMAVLDPLKVVIENFPEGEVRWIDAPSYPHDVPLEGSRPVPFGKTLFIERSDFQEHPEKKFYRLAPGREVRLRAACFLTCDSVVKDPETGEVTELRCSWDPASWGGSTPDNRKVKSTLHWVAEAHGQKAEVRLYDRLFSVVKPGTARDFREDLNPNSLKVIEAIVEPSLSDVVRHAIALDSLGLLLVKPPELHHQGSLCSLDVVPSGCDMGSSGLLELSSLWGCQGLERLRVGGHALPAVAQPARSIAWACFHGLLHRVSQIHVPSMRLVGVHLFQLLQGRHDALRLLIDLLLPHQRPHHVQKSSRS